MQSQSHHESSADKSNLWDFTLHLQIFRPSATTCTAVARSAQTAVTYSVVYRGNPVIGNAVHGITQLEDDRTNVVMVYHLTKHK